MESIISVQVNYINYIRGETQNYVYYFVMQIESKFDKKNYVIYFDIYLCSTWFQVKEKLFFKMGGSIHFHIHFLLGHCDV